MTPKRGCLLILAYARKQPQLHLCIYSFTHIVNPETSTKGDAMQVIAVLNQKGGAGKTTIAVNLARALQLRGKSVVIVDSDPQGTARDHAAVEGSTSPL